MRTTVPIAQEIYSGLCYYADIPEVGKEFLRAKSVAADKVDDAYFAMKSFIRQSQAFCAAAEQAGARASPLTWYYCFLNLAKSFLCLTVPEKVRGRIGHGLTHELKSTGLEKQTLRVVDGGVFGLLYEALFGQPLPKDMEFDVFSLLTYCTDISHEIEQSGALMSTVPVYARLVVDPANQQCYPLLATNRLHGLEASDLGKKLFFEHFEEVSFADARFVTMVFGLPGEVARQFRYFETKNFLKTEPNGGVILPNVEAECLKMIEPLVVENPYEENDGCDLYLCRPLKGATEIPFNQVLATYAALYFLSSLVRYHPVYFEKQLASRDAWIVDSFARSTPITLLRHLANRIFGQGRRYSLR